MSFPPSSISLHSPHVSLPIPYLVSPPRWAWVSISTGCRGRNGRLRGGGREARAAGSERSRWGSRGNRGHQGARPPGPRDTPYSATLPGLAQWSPGMLPRPSPRCRSPNREKPRESEDLARGVPGPRPAPLPRVRPALPLPAPGPRSSFVCGGGGQGADPRPRLRADRSTWRGRVPGRWWQRLAVAARLCSVGRWGRGCARFPTLCSQSAAEGTKQSRGCWAALVSRPHRPACETGLGLGAHVGRQGTRPASELCPPAVTEQRPVARAGPGCWAGGSGRSWELSNQGSSLSDASCPSSRHRTHVPAGHPLVTVCPPEPRLAPPLGPSAPHT